MRDIIFHCHLFKNAGTTIDWALKRNFGAQFHDHRDDIKMKSGSVEYLKSYLSKNDVTALSSHQMPFHPEVFPQGKWIVMLRDPIRRVKSVYAFERLQPVSSLGSKVAKQLNYADYVKWRMRDDVPHVIKDYHVRYLAGISNPAAKPDKHWLEIAKERLRKSNVFFGLVEFFDESMVYFEDNISATHVRTDFSYIKQNQTPYLEQDFIGKEDIEDFVMANNRLDIELHEWAKNEAKARFEKSEGFNEKLKEFKHRCDAANLGFSQKLAKWREKISLS